MVEEEYDEENLEDIVGTELDEDMENEENLSVDFTFSPGLVAQLASNFSMATSRMVESNDIEQDSPELLEEVLRREWRPPVDEKVKSDFYSGSRDEETYVLPDSKPTGPIIAGSYEAVHAAGEVYQGGTQNIRDPNLGEPPRFGEIRGQEWLSTPGSVEKKDLQYETKTY